MAYNFGNIQSKLSILLADSNTGVDDAFPLATRKLELNRAQMQFCKDSKSVLEYATGTITGNSIAVPSDWLETKILIIANQRLDPKREISIEDYDRYYSYGGNPPYYYYWEVSGVRYIYFFGSTNGQTYKWFYFKKPSVDLVNDADLPIVRDEYREALAYFAASELIQQQGKQAISDKYRAIYGQIVHQAQEQTERLSISQIYPNPDLNFIGGSLTDIEGGGWQ